MTKEIVEVPVLSAAVRALGVPLSLVTKAAGLVFVSGTPPLDLTTGRLVKGDIEVQTEASLKALKHCLEAAGTSLDNVVMVRIYAVNSGFYGAVNRVYAKYFPENAPSRTVDVPLGQVPTGIAHSRCVDLLGTFTFSYRVLSLSGKKLSFHDSHTMRDSEYPLGPEWQCLEKLTTRGVEIDASAAVHKLKSKKAL